MKHFLDDEIATKIMGENAHRLIQGFSIANTVRGIESAISKVTDSE